MLRYRSIVYQDCRHATRPCHETYSLLSLVLEYQEILESESVSPLGLSIRRGWGCIYLREGRRETTYPAVMESDNIFPTSSLVLEHLSSRSKKYFTSGRRNDVQFITQSQVSRSLNQSYRSTGQYSGIWILLPIKVALVLPSEALQYLCLKSSYQACPDPN